MPDPAESSSRKRFDLRDPERWPPLGYLGFGTFWAWLFLAILDPYLLEAARSPHRIQPILFVFLAVGVFARPITAFFTSKLQPLVERPLFVVSAAVLPAVGTIVIALAGGREVGSDLLAVIGTGIGSLGMAWTILLWGELYGSVGTRRASMGVALSVMIGVALYFTIAVAFRPGAATAVAATLMPVVGGVLLLVSKPGAELPQGARPLQLAQRFQFPWRLAFAVGVFGVAYGLMHGITNPEAIDARLSFMGCGAAALLVAVGFAVTARDSESPGFTYRLFLPLMAAGFLVLPFLGNPWTVANAIALTAYVCFDMVLWSALSDVSFRLRLPGTVVFGWGWAGEAAVLVGAAVGSTIMARVGLGDSQIHTLSLAMVFLLLLSMLLLLNGRDALGELGATPVAGDAAAPPDDALPDRSALLAITYGLSSREADVLELLLKGRSLPYIAEELEISQNTAKSHVRNLYNKLAVHTRQELLDLAQSTAGNGDSHR